jgi:uncharacterized membrane protein
MIPVFLLSSAMAITPPIIKPVYVPEPNILVIFVDPFDINITSYALTRGSVPFIMSNASNVSRNVSANVSNSSAVVPPVSSSATVLVPLFPPVKTNNTFLFEPVDVLGNDTYTFKITAKDIFGNTESFYDYFQIVELPFNISLKNPPYGVSPTKSFDLIVRTYVNSTCRFAVTDTTFDNSYDFDSSGFLDHTKKGYSLFTEKVDYPLYVKCKNVYGDISAQQFLLSYDTSPPVIKSLSAPDTWDNVVSEPARTATLQVITDEPAVCSASRNGGIFVQFSSNFSTNNSKSFSGLEDFMTHKFDVKCRNKAGLESETKSISIKVDTGIGIGIRVISPTAYVSSFTVPFEIQTSKSSLCKLGNSTFNYDIAMTSSNGFSHSATVYVDSEGNHSYWLGCDYLKVSLNFTGMDFVEKRISFVVDLTPPFINNVTDEGVTSSLSKLNAVVDAYDNESGIKQYYFAIGSYGSIDNDVKDWTVSSSNKLSASGLNLSEASTYVFAVIAENNAGMNSSVSVSSGVLVNASFTGFPSLNVTGENVTVSREGCVVDSDFDGYGLGCVNGLDCDDTINVVNVDCGNGCLQDGDGDGYGVNCFNGRDCNDFDPYVSMGCENKCRLDSDNDGYGPGCLSGPDCNDYDSSSIDACPDNVGCSNDRDCDGMDDQWEIDEGLDPDVDDSGADPDEDGIINIDEYRAGSNPTGSGASNTVQKPSAPQEEEEEKGFSWLLLIIIVVAVLVGGMAGYVGYTFYKKKHPSAKPSRVAYPGYAQKPSAPSAGEGYQSYLASAVRRAAVARKARQLRRERISTQRSSFFDSFAPGMAKERVEPVREEVVLTPAGRKVLFGKPSIKRKESKEFESLSSLLKKKEDSFERLDKYGGSVADAFGKLEKIDERHFEKIDKLIGERKLSQEDVFESLAKINHKKKASREDIVNSLKDLIESRKGK